MDFPRSDFANFLQHFIRFEHDRRADYPPVRSVFGDRFKNIALDVVFRLTLSISSVAAKVTEMGPEQPTCF